MQLGKRWHKLDDSDLAREVQAISESLDKDYSGRDEKVRQFVSLYEGERLDDLSPTAYASTGSGMAAPLSYNLYRSLCDTAQAEIAGRQKPKPSFMTSGGDYKTKRRARMLEKFVESQLEQPQGLHANGWELLEEAELDATISGASVVKVFDDSDSIRMELVPWGQVRVDLEEAAHGMPRNWFQSGPIDRDLALRMFCGSDDEPEDESSDDTDAIYERAKRRNAINTAKSYKERHGSFDGRVAPPIRYVEAWHVPYDDDDKGRHVITINGAIMLDEEWDRAAPFLVLRWAKERLGFWGVGLVHEARGIVTEVNDQAEKIQARHKLCGSKRTYYQRGSIDETLLESNEHEQFIAFAPNSAHPIEVAPNPVSASEVEWLESNFRRAYELTAVSQMNATARKEPGITAAVAILAAQDLQSKRFAIKARNYENSYVTLARLIVDCARAIANKQPDFKLPFPGSSFHGEITWKDVDLADDMYIISIQPSSALPSSFSGRLQVSQDLLDKGAISPQTFMRLIDMPDLKEEYEAQNSERERIEWEVARMLDADSAKGFEFHTPDGYILDPLAAMQVVVREYNRALRDSAPDQNLELLRGYIRSLEELIKRAMPPQPDPMGSGPVSPPPLGGSGFPGAVGAPIQ